MKRFFFQGKNEEDVSILFLNHCPKKLTCIFFFIYRPIGLLCVFSYCHHLLISFFFFTLTFAYTVLNIKVLFFADYMPDSNSFFVLANLAYFLFQETIVYEEKAVTALWEAIASQQEQINILKEDVKKTSKGCK